MPCKLFHIDSIIFQWNCIIERLLFLSTSTPLYEIIVMYLKCMMILHIMPAIYHSLVNIILRMSIILENLTLFFYITKHFEK